MKTIPNQIKKAKGTLRKDQIHNNIEGKKLELGMMPPFNSLPPDVQNMYNYYIELLQPHGILQEFDAVALRYLAFLSVEINDMFENRAMRNVKGTSSITDLMRVWNTYASKFGLNPSDRGRIKTDVFKGISAAERAKKYIKGNKEK